MRSMRTSLVRPLLAATVVGVALSSAPATAATTTYSASYSVKAGARTGSSETAREVADIRRVALSSSTSNQLRVAVTADEVPTRASRIDGVYSVEVEFDNGDVQTLTYSTDTVSVTAGLVVAGGLLDLAADAEITLRTRHVEVTGEGCDSWTATADHRSDTVVFQSRTCGDVRFVDEVTVEGVAVTTADKRVGYDASGHLEHNVRIR